MLSGAGLLRLKATRPKGATDLVVQINPVGDQDDLRIRDSRGQCERLGEHHHGERFSAPLRVPYHTASSIFVLFG